MEQILVLGTGNAGVTECFNTCFVLDSGEGQLLVDTGGGNGLLKQLRAFGLRVTDIHDLYLSHEHCDHLGGIIWILRMVTGDILAGRYSGNLNIWCQKILEPKVRAIAGAMLLPKQTDLFGKRIIFHIVEDGDTAEIIGRQFTFFDIRSVKAPQFGFTVRMDCGKLVFAGDEPLSPAGKRYAEHADWLLSEAFCASCDTERFHPYEKQHSTARDGGALAQRLGVRNLVLWHTEDSDMAHRREKYTADASVCYSGNILVPDDLERIKLI